MYVHDWQHITLSEEDATQPGPPPGHTWTFFTFSPCQLFRVMPNASIWKGGRGLCPCMERGKGPFPHLEFLSGISAGGRARGRWVADGDGPPCTGANPTRPTTTLVLERPKKSTLCRFRAQNEKPYYYLDADRTCPFQYQASSPRPKYFSAGGCQLAEQCVRYKQGFVFMAIEKRRDGGGLAPPPLSPSSLHTCVRGT